MKTLHVFYDPACAFCLRCREWLERQPKFIELKFTPYSSPQATMLCPRLAEFHPDREIVVMSDNGDIYTGGAAWTMALYATRSHRALALRLGHPTLQPLARKVCHLVSRNRYRISRFFNRDANEVAAEIENLVPAAPDCADGRCAL